MTIASPQPNTYLMWFRRDLRLHDNTALTLLSDKIKQAAQSASDAKSHPQAASSQPKAVALFTVTAQQWLEHDMSLVQMDLLFRTLKQLATRLYNNHNLVLHLIDCANFADSIDAIASFCQTHHISQMFSNQEYEVNEQKRDRLLMQKLAADNIEYHNYHDQCILPPGTITTGDDTMYKVFTPFYKKWQQTLSISPTTLYDSDDVIINSKAALDTSDTSLEAVLDNINQYYQKTLNAFKAFYKLSDDEVDARLARIQTDYPAGEEAALQRLNNFVKQDIDNYSLTRDQPALMATSHLSAYLAIGAISPRVCYVSAQKKYQQALESQNNDTTQGASQDIERWISELAWRDFYRHVIVDRPDIIKGVAYKKETDSQLNWSYESAGFEKWCNGMTGVPLIDAAMRCLNQTGFMHNRLRMVTAMFLTKDLFIDWRCGERYFMQALIDGDFASNNGGWQWSASTGTDAAPYFRIMNPFSQAKTHDKDAIFIKTWLPELKDIDANTLHDEAKLRKALSKKGAFAHVNYPLPMVEHKKARLYAIAQFKGE